MHHFIVLFMLILAVVVSAAADVENMPGEEDSLADSRTFSYFQRPIVQTRSLHTAKLDCILNLRSFELCRNLL